MNNNPIEHVLGTRVRAKHKESLESLNQCFANPIIHKEIHGDKVYVPLNLNRVWNSIR